MINATIESYWDEKWWATIDWEELQKYWPLATNAEKPKNAYSITGPCRITYDEANAIAKLGVKLTIAPLPGAMITKMRDGVSHAWEYGTRIEGEHLVEGKAVQVAVPDMALMYIDEVCVETDFCTDALQEMLNDGWRILAICPPNSSRRPDYVLGRRKKQDPFGGYVRNAIV